MEKRKIVELLIKKRARRGIVKIVQTLSNPSLLCLASSNTIVTLGLVLILAELQTLALVRKMKIISSLCGKKEELEVKEK